MEVEYRPGNKMQHVGALSRNPVAVNLISGSETDWFLTVQLRDDKAQAIVTALKQGIAAEDVKATFKVKDRRLWRITSAGDRLYVPANSIIQLLRKHHDDIGHPGYERCLDLLRETYWFPKMARFVRNIQRRV